MLVGIEDVTERMMGAGKLDIEEIISMTRIEYFLLDNGFRVRRVQTA